MKDMWGKEAKVGDVFVHPCRQSSSIWMNKYEIVSIDDSTEKIKARILNRNPRGYRVFVYVPNGQSYYHDMTQAERAKVDAKTVKISTFSNRSTIL